MRRVLQLLGLSVLSAAGFLSTLAFAQEPEEPTKAAAEQPAEEPKAELPAPVVPAAAPPSSVAPTAAVAAPAAAALAPAAGPKIGDFSVHGYFRGGIGANVPQKGRMTCFQLNLGGLLSKYRLGNECEVWAELNTTTVVYAGEDGSVAHLHFMPVAYIPTTFIGYPATGVTTSDQGDLNSRASVAFPNLYADIQGIPWLFGGTAWAGTRYYKRESIYISDFFYWNPSGVGAGIEDINVARVFAAIFEAFGWSPSVWNADMVKDLTFSYGVFAVDGRPSGTPPLPVQMDFGLRNDFQIRGFQPWWGAELQLGFQYIKDWSNDYPNTRGGWGGTFQYLQDVLVGNNKVAVQYGVDGGSGFGTLARFYYPDFSITLLDVWRFRALDVLTIQPFGWLGLQANVVYQHDKNKTPSNGDWLSAGMRVSFAPTEHLKLLSEVGHDRLITSAGNGNRQLTKVTGAVAIASAKGFWARPELRLFYTWALWDQNAAVAGVDSGDLYTNPISENGPPVYRLSGSIAGLQAEAVW